MNNAFKHLPLIGRQHKLFFAEAICHKAKKKDGLLGGLLYTPKHASWLNMAEMEISVMDRQCSGGRVESKEKLKADVKAWAKQRNKNKNTIEWKFTRQDADRKLSKHYVS